ncbi:hypothetical protein N7508_006456 [Penicillium antarcticum]|uniref:uncharacterized protein n=1 Tax=Penicillium antarcticum TaxID=416450 RepID=UPI0023A3C4EA|nr:uncharacterized protein N7508_006456 [Penicillium antarcticum]KAJ5301593.1 hypothetical protein N7508_006456 [Penicillium antarcticum]
MKIVIIGAGIAGCAAYLELRKHLPNPSESDGDHEIIIYEAYSTDLDMTADQRTEEHTHPSTLLVGGGLAVGPNGLNVLRRLDENLLKDVVRGGYVTATSNMKNKNGWQLAKMDTSLSPNEPDNPENMYMVATSRHSFWQELRSRVPDEHIINKRISEVVARPEGRNLIYFADGTPSVKADLVIGADGVQSTAKRALFPDARNPYPPRYEGLVGVGGFIPAADVKGLVEKGSMNFIFGGNGFFGYFYADSAESVVNRDSPYHVSEPGESLAWWSTYGIEDCPDRKTLDMGHVTRQLRERHADWKDPVVQKIVQSLHVTNMYPTWTSPALPTWERDGVVLVGDAAHALPPSSGQGSSQALEDVEAFILFLAHYLRKHGIKDTRTTPESQKEAIRVASQQYVSLRKPRVQEISEFARKTQNTKRQMGLFQEYSMYAFMKLLGLFPSLMTSQIRKVTDYNIAEQVAKVIASEK